MQESIEIHSNSIRSVIERRRDMIVVVSEVKSDDERQELSQCHHAKNFSDMRAGRAQIKLFMHIKVNYHWLVRT